MFWRFGKSEAAIAAHCSARYPGIVQRPGWIAATSAALARHATKPMWRVLHCCSILIQSVLVCVCPRQSLRKNTESTIH